MLWVLGHHKSGNLRRENLFSFKEDPATQPAWRVESLTGGWPHEITRNRA